MKHLTTLILIFLMASCVSVKKYNKNMYVLRTEKALRKDVDYLHRKLEKLHPNLYWYISKAELDYKFDSLKSTLIPMTSNEFYGRISPVLASVRQGHNAIFPLTERISKEEMQIQKEKGINPLNQFKYELFDGRLYIVKNNSADTSIAVGTEVVAINGITPQEIYTKYAPCFTSDGYNETHFPNMFARVFPHFYQWKYEKLLLDSALYLLQYDDIITEHLICRTKKDAETGLMARFKTSETESEKKKLTYPVSDSSIALMSIPSFSSIIPNLFYKHSFEQMQTANTQTLIIDLRNNPGGVIVDIKALSAYLTDSPYYLLRKAEVASRTSLLQPNIFKGNSLAVNIILAIFYPFKIVQMGVIAAEISKEDEKYYYHLSGSKLSQPNPQHFKGEVYVLINGGSFSAASTISSNLHGAKRAVFVGEETGGAYNGCVAGRFYKFTLPKSKLKGAFGLATIQPHYQTDTEGRGIMPDIAVLPTLEDRINGIDPELNAVLDLVRGKSMQKNFNIEKCKDGDFVFVSNDASAFDDAVVSVTKNEENSDFSHVGLIHCTDSGLFVIEAITQGVCYTPVDTFLHRNSNSAIRVARLKSDYQQYIPEAIATALSHLGKKYDFAFDLNNDAYYCSELLYVAFASASGDSLFFETPPMTFIDETTNDFHSYWVGYFKELNTEIPEGKPGLNPNGMSLSDKLEWVRGEFVQKEFVPDSTINNLFFLRDDASSEVFYPNINNIKLLDEELFSQDVSPHIIFLNADKTKYLIAFLHEGTFINWFSEFAIGYVTEAVFEEIKDKYIETSYKNFQTESNLHLGMTLSELESIKGKNYIREGDKITYCYNSLYSEFLEYGGCEYYLECELSQNKVCKIRFGFTGL